MSELRKQRAPRRIAMGVIVSVMGGVLVPQTGPLGFLQIFAGGLMIYRGITDLVRTETK